MFYAWWIRGKSTVLMFYVVDSGKIHCFNVLCVVDPGEIHCFNILCVVESEEIHCFNVLCVVDSGEIHCFNILCVVDSEQCNKFYDNSLNILRVSSYTFLVRFFFSPTTYDSLLNNPLNPDKSRCLRRTCINVTVLARCCNNVWCFRL